MNKTVMLTDTTLRDGEQSPGMVLSSDDKVRLMQLLDETGVYQVDAGIPAMGARVKDILVQMMAKRRRIKVSTWNRMNPKDILDAMDVMPDVIHISAPVSDRLIHRLLNKDREWVVRTLKSCVAMAREKGFEVTVGFVDASRADISFMIMLANCLYSMGVTMVKLADTVGILTPQNVRKLAWQMVENTDIPLGIHTHNDLGMAVPIAIEAVKAGITHVDTTCFGVGERAGNCDLFSFVDNGMPLFAITPSLHDVSLLRKYAADILFAKSPGQAWNYAYV